MLASWTQMSFRQSLMRGTSTNGTLARILVGKHWIRSVAGSSAPYLWRSPFGHTLGFTHWVQDKEKLNSTQWLREGYHAFVAQRDWLRLTAMSRNVDVPNGKCSMTNLLLEKSYDQEKVPFAHRIHAWAHGSIKLNGVVCINFCFGSNYICFLSFHRASDDEIVINGENCHH